MNSSFFKGLEVRSGFFNDVFKSGISFKTYQKWKVDHADDFERFNVHGLQVLRIFSK